MATFQFSRMKNPVMVELPVQPEGLEQVTFKLSPFNTNTAFKVEAWRNSQDDTESAQRQFDLGASRIMGWIGIQDENGQEVTFNQDTFGQYLNMYEAIPYIMEVGSQTIEEASEKLGKKQAPKKEAEPLEEPKEKAAQSESNSES